MNWNEKNIHSELELQELLEEYGMEEITEDGDNTTSYVWYKGTQIKFEGLMVEGNTREEVVTDLINILIRNPQWKI